jgi:hypothetical protein
MAKEQTDEKKVKQGMTLKSVPISLKKIKRVLSDLSKSEEGITAEQKFDLKVSKMYAEYIVEVVTGLLEDVE